MYTPHFNFLPIGLEYLLYLLFKQHDVLFVSSLYYFILDSKRSNGGIDFAMMSVILCICYHLFKRQYCSLIFRMFPEKLSLVSTLGTKINSTFQKKKKKIAKTVTYIQNMIHGLKFSIIIINVRSY